MEKDDEAAPGARVPSGHLVLGIPARVARPLKPEEIENFAVIRDRRSGTPRRSMTCPR